MGTEPTHASLVEAADDFVSHMMQIQDEAKAALTHAAEEMSKYYDRRRTQTPDYKVGDQVWLNAQNYSTDRPMKKLDHKWLGPFKVLKIVSKAALKLQFTPKERGIHPVVSTTNVRKYHPDNIPERPTYHMPGPTLIDGEEEYEVEEILDSKYIRGNLHYYVRWKGYPNSENSWLPIHNLHAPNLLASFHQTHPRAPKPHSTPATPRRRGLRGG
jgi:hypothetical protein